MVVRTPLKVSMSKEEQKRLKKSIRVQKKQRPKEPRPKESNGIRTPHHICPVHVQTHHIHREIHYGANVQLTHKEDVSLKLNKSGILRVQSIVGAALFNGRAVNNKILVAINSIGTQQASETEATNDAVHQLLDYLATYPDDGILYQASDMILAAHSDAGFHNDSKGRSRAGAHIFLSENDPIPRWNGPILTVAQIIKFVLTSDAEAELGALFVTAQKMVLLRQTLM